MKAVRMFTVVMMLFVSAFSQMQPNLENGFKPYGSYDSGGLEASTRRMAT